MTRFDIFLTRCGNPPQLEEHAGSLSASTRTRLLSIASIARRNQYLWGRLLLAKAAERVSGHGGWLAFIEEKPHPVFSNHPDWSISLSHSGSWIAAVISQGIRVGIDLECLTKKKRNWQSLIKRVVGCENQAPYSEMSIDEQAMHFCKEWTLREAAFKAGLRPRVLGPLLPVSHSLHWESHSFAEGWLTLAAPVAFHSQIQEITW